LTDTTDIRVHPVAELFPMMSDEELADLAEDIRERGQLQAIVLGPDGEILDGRNRYAACRLAGVEPRFEKYEGDDADGFALAVNTERRNLKPSQKHMIKEMARRHADASGRAPGKQLISCSSAEAQRLSEAAVILDHAPDLAREVAAGVMPLYKAAEIARDNKKRAAEESAKRGLLKGKAPDLLGLVDDDQLSLDEAVKVLETRTEKAQREAEAKKAEAQRAAEEAQRERRAATTLLCKLIPALAEIDGAALARQYETGQAGDYPVTSGVLAEAQRVLDEIVQVWQERDLP